MDVTGFTDDLFCAVMDHTRLREMYALFCTCKRLRDLSHTVEFWRRRCRVKYWAATTFGSYPECRIEVTRRHYDLESLTYPLSKLDVWRDFSNVMFPYDADRSKLSKAILRMAKPEQLMDIIIDDFTCRSLMAVGNPALTERCIRYIVSEPRRPKWVVAALIQTRSLRKTIRKTVINRIVKDEDPIPTVVSSLLGLTDEAIDGASPDIPRTLAGFLSLLSVESEIELIPLDILYILRAIELIRAGRRHVVVSRRTPLMDKYDLPTGETIYLCDYKLHRLAARGVWCVAARYVKMF